MIPDNLFALLGEYNSWINRINGILYISHIFLHYLKSDYVKMLAAQHRGTKFIEIFEKSVVLLKAAGTFFGEDNVLNLMWYFRPSSEILLELLLPLFFFLVKYFSIVEPMSLLSMQIGESDPITWKGVHFLMPRKL
ncbi:hypothetical protein ACJX0J_034715, partial [Zea mays]